MFSKIIRSFCRGLLVLTTILLSYSDSAAQERTIGLMVNKPGAYAGYNLFNPLNQDTTYLINNAGSVVHKWAGLRKTGHTWYFTDDAILYRAGQVTNEDITGLGGGGIIEAFDWDSNLIWSFTYSDSQKRQHHDFELLPNGNILILAWEFKSDVEAMDAGREPGTMATNKLWPEHVVEVKPDLVTGVGGTIVWEWHLWDHLIQELDDTKANFGVVSDHPELVDINYHKDDNADWIHANAINYNPALDQIAISAHAFNEFWVIDHSTTTSEAQTHAGGNSGKGGDLLYRWGNPQTYKRGVASDQQLFNQHHVHWIPAGLPNEGKFLIFNNGVNRPEGNYSTIVMVDPPVDNAGNYSLPASAAYGPSSVFYEYTAPTPTDFYSFRFSGAQQLPNGNILVCSGNVGTFFEIDPNEDIVWKYISPVNGDGLLTQGASISTVGGVFRLTRLPLDHPGLIGKDLTPTGPIELDSLITALTNNEINNAIKVYPNPSSNSLVVLAPNLKGMMRIYDLKGILKKEEMVLESETIDISELEDGVYILKINEYAQRIVIKK